ncbi:MAG: transporter [Nocardia sp.]|uniref:MFS transporter n=1 Tax=Nocardia sp. TaxID=1821 RepID=UPI00261BECD1|nr:MFS transporter [Nocardia sp.]MCU1642537.1 transporter [Nocardia sp.]
MSKPVLPPGTELPAAPKAKGWRQLALLSGLLSMDSSEAAVVSTLFPALRSALGLPLSALGVLVAVSKVIWMICGPIWVLVAQRIGRKKVLVVFCGVWGLWSCAAGLAQNFAQLLVLYAIAAVGYAAGGPLVNGILADLFDESRRGRAAGWLYGGTALIGAVLGPLFGQLSRVPDGWRYGFFASGTITVIFGLIVWRFFEEPAVGAAESEAAVAPRQALNWSDVRGLLAGRTLRLILVQRLASTQLAMTSFGVVYLVDVRHFSTATASIVLPFALLTYVLGTIIGGFVSDRVQRWLPRAGRLGVWQTSVLGWGLAAGAATQIGWSSIWVYAAIFSVLGLLQGFVPGTNRPIVMAVTRPELRGAAFSLMISAESLGWALSTLLIGFLGDRIGLQTTFLWLIVVLNIVNGIFMTVMYRPYLRESSALRAAHSVERLAPRS